MMKIAITLVERELEECIDLAELDIVNIHPLIHHRTLLKKDLPGGYGRADVSIVR